MPNHFIESPLISHPPLLEVIPNNSFPSRFSAPPERGSSLFSFSDRLLPSPIFGMFHFLGLEGFFPLLLSRPPQTLRLPSVSPFKVTFF